MSKPQSAHNAARAAAMQRAAEINQHFPLDPVAGPHAQVMESLPSVHGFTGFIVWFVNESAPIYYLDAHFASLSRKQLRGVAVHHRAVA